MKAAAMSIESNDNETEHQPSAVPLGDVTKRQEFKDAVVRAKHREPAFAATMEATECFVVMWKDEISVCPERGCELRKQCQTGFQEAVYQISVSRPLPPLTTAETPTAVLHTDSSPVTSSKSKKSTKKQIIVPQLQAPAPVLAPKPKAKVKKAPKTKKPATEVVRGRWKGTGKFQRLGYQPLNRPVDHALATFLNALGQPARLPTKWSPIDFAVKFGQLGRIVLSQTASYTSVIVDGSTVCRFWVNAGGCAIIDIVDDLVKAVKTIPGVMNVAPVSPGSAKKLSPCTHRFELAFGAGTPNSVLQTLANYIRMAYRG